MKKTIAYILILSLVLGVGAFGYTYRFSILQKLRGKQTVADVVAEVGESATAKLRRAFDAVGAAYPPTEVTLIVLKEERRVELWSGGDSTTFIKSYDIRGASGVAGPKLREGDLQVPEGNYSVEGLNPNSAFHLSMKVNYPNEYDLAQAEVDGRTNLGGDIFIHGGSASVGCVAVGNDKIEELFTLASEIGHENIRVIIAPYDFREGRRPNDTESMPNWVESLYRDLVAALREYDVAE